ncbi:energy transducer TonB [Pedobacter insulae]|uniref:Outer membrane transport energization protein TonB n=1 Tax=Pedobacter insulae TaxID=414048 RepID=A0A1I2VG20_9SPHI|nr:energy transducer TonB [Pedobacter insulae]SFG88238.1 outer membrane transport energization protein TonB [Pedobacter insulae]
MLNNSNLYGNGWLDVVFSNRNKNYGAYALRTQSAGILLKSLFIAAPVFIFLFVGPTIYNKIFPAPVQEMETQVVIAVVEPIHELKKEEPKKEEQKKELPKAEPVKKKLKTVNFSEHVVVVNKEVEDPPTSAELSNAIISNITQEGVSEKGNAQSPIGNGEGNVAGNAPTGNGNEIYSVAGVEAYPEFPGGMAAWSKFIQRNLKYPYAAQENGIQGKVFLSFVIEKDGSISDVNVIRGIGSGCDEEAVRVIKKSPKWKAGQQNNQPVRVRYTMPIGYVLSN